MNVYACKPWVPEKGLEQAVAFIPERHAKLGELCCHACHCDRPLAHLRVDPQADGATWRPVLQQTVDALKFRERINVDVTAESECVLQLPDGLDG